MSTTITATGYLREYFNLNSSGSIVNYSAYDSNYGIVNTYRTSSGYRFYSLLFKFPAFSITSGQRIINAKLRLIGRWTGANQSFRIARVDKSDIAYGEWSYYLEGSDSSVLNDSYTIQSQDTFQTVEIPIENFNPSASAFYIKLYAPISRAKENSNGAVYINYNSAYSGAWPSITFDTESVPPGTPSIVYPNGDVVDKTQQATFRWVYNSGGGLAQQSFDFAHRLTTGSWPTDTHVSSASASYTPSDLSTWPVGMTEWRVRTYNSSGLASPYAYGTFELIGPPAPPMITGITNNAVPTVTWQASTTETAVAELEIRSGADLVWSSGVISGINRSVVVDKMLANGTYTARLRTASVYGDWSQWTGRQFTISASAPTTPSITLSALSDSIVITATSGNNVLYRAEGNGEFKPIAKFMEQHEDATVQPGIVYTYFVRNYVTGYADSVKKSGSVNYRGYRLADINSPGDSVALVYNIDKPFGEIARNLAKSVMYNTYVGRSYEVKESGLLKSESFSLSNYLSKKDFERLREMFNANSTYILRGKEILMYCDFAIETVKNEFFNDGYAVTLKCKRIDHDAEVHFNV